MSQGFPSEGQHFAPYRLFLCFMIPISISAHPKLSATAKLLYGCIYYHSGRRSICFASEETMALEIGRSIDTVGRAMKELVRYGLVLRRRGRGRTFETCLVWSEKLRKSLRPGSAERVLASRTADRKTAKMRRLTPQQSDCDAAETQDPLEEEFQQDDLTGIPSSRESTTTGPASDNSNEPQIEVSRLLRQCFNDRQWPLPAGEMPIEEITLTLKSEGCEAEDLLWFFVEYEAKLKDLPATWSHVLISFEKWVAHRRNVLWKRSVQRTRIAEGEASRNTPMSVENAAGLIEHGRLQFAPDSEWYTWRISDGLLEDLREQGVTRMSPLKLLEAEKQFRENACAACRGTGIVEVDKSELTPIKFCDCRHGQRARRLDPDKVDRHNKRLPRAP